jgi:hypothetical protein
MCLSLIFAEFIRVNSWLSWILLPLVLKTCESVFETLTSKGELTGRKYKFHSKYNTRGLNSD